MKKRIGFMVMMCVLIALLGCSSVPKEELVGKEQEPITLRMTWWGNDNRNKATVQVIRMYEALNPHVRIEFEHTGFNEYWKKLAPYAAGNTIPDIVQMDISYLKQYSSLNLLEDLQPYIQDGTIDASHISEASIASGQIDEQVYGVSLGVNALFAAYDPEVLAAKGIEPPADDWTWDDLDEMGEQLLGSGIYLGTSLTPEQFFSYYLRQHGHSLFAKSGTELGYEDDRLFIEYFGRMQRFVKDKLFFPPDIWTPDVRSSFLDPFYRGEALLSWGYSNQYISIAETYGKPLKIVAMPGPNKEQGLFLKPGMFFSIAQSSKHKEEAAKFISYFVNDLEANKVLKGERGVPVSSEVKEQMKPYIEPALAQVFEYIDWVEKHSSPIDPPDPVGAAEVTTVLRGLYDLLLFNKITPEKAAEEFRREAELILARNR